MDHSSPLTAIHSVLVTTGQLGTAENVSAHEVQARTSAKAADLTLALLESRSLEATICPSEVARALAAHASTGSTEPDWREAMPAVHAAVDQLASEGVVQLSWKGKTLATRAGLYRIRRAGRI